jgi:hypothetical protein
MLRETPLCLPAFFTVSGLAPDEGCVIERTEEAAFVHPAPSEVANHWLENPRAGHDRGNDSRRRHALMKQLRRCPCDGFDWLLPPILNPTTCLAVMMNATQGSLRLIGIANSSPATQVFTLPSAECAGT